MASNLRAMASTVIAMVGGCQTYKNASTQSTCTKPSQTSDGRDGAEDAEVHDANMTAQSRIACIETGKLVRRYVTLFLVRRRSLI